LVVHEALGKLRLGDGDDDGRGESRRRLNHRNTILTKSAREILYILSTKVFMRKKRKEESGLFYGKLIDDAVDFRRLLLNHLDDPCRDTP